MKWKQRQRESLTAGQETTLSELKPMLLEWYLVEQRNKVTKEQGWKVLRFCNDIKKSADIQFEGEEGLKMTKDIYKKLFGENKVERRKTFQRGEGGAEQKVWKKLNCCNPTIPDKAATIEKIKLRDKSYCLQFCGLDI